MSRAFTYPIVFLALLNLGVASLVFNDPKQDVKRARRVWGGYAIPLAKGERMVFYDPKYHRAYSVLILVDSSYERVRRELRDIVVKKIGIAGEGEVGEHDPVIFPKPEALFPELSGELVFEKAFVKFRAIGVRIDQPKEYQIKSQRYNEVDKFTLTGSSELRLRIADGKVLFGKKCALIVLSRTDYTREHLRYYDIPLPFKASFERELVTDTEIRLIENLIAQVGKAKARYFVPPTPGLKDAQYWVEFMRGIREAVKDF